jgi:hypothetical protein
MSNVKLRKWKNAIIVCLLIKKLMKKGRDTLNQKS